jgi:microcin C transport system ATP-binding protein
VVRNLCLDIRPGECLALVGESGSGKSVTAHSILQLLPDSGTATGSIRYRGQELLGAPSSVLRELRGNRIAMIFQEPMTSLNPLHSIEKQIGETLLVHRAWRARWRNAHSGTAGAGRHPETQERLKAYPHQLSGGQRQRVMIAMPWPANRNADCRRTPRPWIAVQRKILLLLKSCNRLACRC